MPEVTAQHLVRIAYRGGMLPTNDPDTLPWRVWDGDALTSAIRERIDQERVLALGGTYGNRLWGDPVQYDELRLTLASGDEIMIVCYNRALGLIYASTEALRAIHRVIGTLTQKE
jgi:hypothetical protein